MTQAGCTNLKHQVKKVKRIIDLEWNEMERNEYMSFQQVQVRKQEGERERECV